MKKLIGLFFLLGLLFSCESELKFDSKEWKKYDYTDMNYSVREKMLSDLLNNVLVLGETKEIEVYALLGEPYLIEDGAKKYLVKEKYKQVISSIIDPIGYIYLELYFNENSLLAYWKIEETTKAY